jgi:pectate lyase
MSLIGIDSKGSTDICFNAWVSKDITLSTSPTNLIVGTSMLPGRMSLCIINDSSDMIFVGTNADLTVANSQLTIQSGQEVRFKFDREIPVPMYAVLEEGSNFVKIIETR